MTERSPVRIACLGWGSLIWSPGDLPLATGWASGGPCLPVEFCRVGDHHELATALCPGAGPVPTRWAELRCSSLSEAIDQLREREGISPSRPQAIGSVTGLQHGEPAVSTAFCAQEIAVWGQNAGLDAVIWTGLPPRFHGQEGRAPSGDEAVAYLRSLSGAALQHARQYVQRVPADIRTPTRSLVERDLGWLPN